MRSFKLIFGLALLICVIIVSGCAIKTSDPLELQLYNYPGVVFPTADKVTLIRPASNNQDEQVMEKKDVAELMKVLRTAVDTPLTEQKLDKNAWAQNRTYSLELQFTKPVKFELAVQKNKTIELETQKALVNLEQKTLLLEVKDEVKGFSGLSLGEDFLKFIKSYSTEKGFPLPPAKQGYMNIEQIPLAKPGVNGVELLPPAEPRRQLGH